MSRQRFLLTAALLALSCLLLFGCGDSASPSDTEAPLSDTAIQIGMSFDTFVLERWIRDRDVFISTAADLGAEVNVQNANGSAEQQASQIEYLIEKGMNVIVIVAVDGKNEALRSAIERARASDIRIIAYDRSIESANVDLYASFDNVRVGELMAETVISQIPDGGRIAALCGSPTDNNVTLVDEGIASVLARHGMELVYHSYADNWKSEYAYDQMNECLDQTGDVDGVICGNDALAAMAFKALSERQLAGDVCLVGQDADIDACQRIVEGSQYMTVYKSIDDLARRSAECAVKLAKREPLEITETFSDGSYEIPFLKLEPVAVTAENMDSAIIDSRFHLKNEVYLNVAKR